MRLHTVGDALSPGCFYVKQDLINSAMRSRSRGESKNVRTFELKRTESPVSNLEGLQIEKHNIVI